MLLKVKKNIIFIRNWCFYSFSKNIPEQLSDDKEGEILENIEFQGHLCSDIALFYLIVDPIAGHSSKIFSNLSVIYGKKSLFIIPTNGTWGFIANVCI